MAGSDQALHYVDAEWVLPSGVDADMACVRALWWFASDVVSRGVTHPWPRATTVAELVQILGRLCSTPAGPAELDRWRGAEALLQAEVTGRRSDDYLAELAAMAGRNQTGPEFALGLPFTELRRRLAAAEHRLLELEAEGAAKAFERDALLDQLADEQGARAALLGRLHAEEDERYAVAARLEAERAAVAATLVERDALLAELAGGRVAAARWAALERWQLVRLYRLVKRLARSVVGRA